MTMLMVGREGPRILTPLAPCFLHEGTRGFSAPTLHDKSFGVMLLLPHGPSKRVYVAPPKSLATVEHLKGLLLLAKTQRRLYIIVVFQGGPITPLGLLQVLHTWSALARIPIFRSDETKDGHKPRMSCCPFCTYTIQNDPAYLNHIVGVHYNANFMCGTCLSAVPSSGQQMKKHINECSGLAPPPMTTSQESVRGERLPKKSAHGSKHTGSKKKGHHSEKSRPASLASQEDSQARDRRVTCTAGTSQESTAKSMKHHSRQKKKAKTHKKEKSGK